MRETTWILDTATGALTVEGLASGELRQQAEDLLPPGAALNCARPLGVPPRHFTNNETADHDPTLRVWRLYHGSVVDGPGRCSVVQLAGCLLGCPGCYVPETHPLHSGTPMRVEEVVRCLLASAGEPRAGITILGGEPFLQVPGLLALVQRLKQYRQHLTLYSGYTLAQLLARAEAPDIRQILRHTDVLIDGPYIKALADGAGEWRGSTNQRILTQQQLSASLGFSSEERAGASD